MQTSSLPQIPQRISLNRTPIRQSEKVPAGELTEEIRALKKPVNVVDMDGVTVRCSAGVRGLVGGGDARGDGDYQS